jgi:hypothetical protein
MKKEWVESKWDTPEDKWRQRINGWSPELGWKEDADRSAERNGQHKPGRLPSHALANCVLTPEDGLCMISVRDKVEIGNSV